MSFQLNGGQKEVSPAGGSPPFKPLNISSLLGGMVTQP